MARRAGRPCLKLLIDEVLPATIAEGLRARGHDAIAVVEDPALRGRGDPHVFETAQDGRRAVVTYEREDFLVLDRQYRRDGRDHHGVVILHPRRFPQGPATAASLATALDALIRAGAAYPSFVSWLDAQPPVSRAGPRRP